MACDGSGQDNVFDYKFQILMKEWDHCQTAIRGLDDTTIKIRTWAVTLLTGFLIVAIRFTQPKMILWAILPIVVFWVFDAIFKHFQHLFIERNEEISAIFQGVAEATSETAAHQSLSGASFPKYADYLRDGHRGANDLPYHLRECSISRAIRIMLFWNVSLIYAGAIIFVLVMGCVVLPT